MQAGRYSRPGVYLGAKQSASGGAQAALQLDITKGLKLETTTGMGGGNPQGASDSERLERRADLSVRILSRAA